MTKLNEVTYVYWDEVNRREYFTRGPRDVIGQKEEVSNMSKLQDTFMRLILLNYRLESKRLVKKV